MDKVKFIMIFILSIELIIVGIFIPNIIKTSTGYGDVNASEYNIGKSKYMDDSILKEIKVKAFDKQNEIDNLITIKEDKLLGQAYQVGFKLGGKVFMDKYFIDIYLNTLTGGINDSFSDEKVKQTFFHEYLHVIFHKNYKDKDYDEILSQIKKSESDVKFYNYLINKLDLTDKENILTEFISYSYEYYYDGYCTYSATDLENLLINKKLLPDITCKSNNE